MDQDGISPVHHESFAWGTLRANYKITTAAAGIYYKSGKGWGVEGYQMVTRFTLFDDNGILTPGE